VPREVGTRARSSSAAVAPDLASGVPGSPGRGRGAYLPCLATRCEGEGALRFGQLAAGAPVLAQRIWRRLVECHAIGLLAELLQIAHERFEAPRVAAIGGEHPSRTRVERARIFTRRLRGAFSGYGTTLLSARHSVPIPTARTAAVPTTPAVAAALLEAIRAIDGFV